MLRFICFCLLFWFCLLLISIHPMLRFIEGICQKRKTDKCISIHPMLRFIIQRKKALYVSIVISIHPMLRFIQENRKNLPETGQFQYIPCYGLSPKVQQYIDRVESFQYIPCYGLSALGAGLREPPLYFNTSHVTVYQTEASKEFRSSHISIHPMLRFIESCLSR